MPATLAHRSICPSQHTVRRIEAVIQARSLNRLRKKEGRAQYYFMKHGRMEIECLHDLSWSIENCATSVRSGLFPQPARVSDQVRPRSAASSAGHARRLVLRLSALRGFFPRRRLNEAHHYIAPTGMEWRISRNTKRRSKHSEDGLRRTLRPRDRLL